MTAPGTLAKSLIDSSEGDGGGRQNNRLLEWHSPVDLIAGRKASGRSVAPSAVRPAVWATDCISAAAAEELLIARFSS